MKHMSFALTTSQIRNRTKTVTRRMGWATAKRGVNAIRRWAEDRSVPEGSYLRQMRAVCVRDE
jgi:hypothetical protein